MIAVLNETIRDVPPSTSLHVQQMPCMFINLSRNLSAKASELLELFRS